MALTRPRAYQIYDLDYKQSVRVVTLTNVTLAGGAPNAVDGVNLSVNDRILVIGQTNPVQNGIYYVTSLGTGSNGTWARSIDTDTTGELESGTIVMVTEGVAYADTQWKLTTNDPIVIGTTALTFVQNYLANSISFGQTSFAIASTNANATISVAEVSNVAVFSNTGAFVTGLVSATGNVSGGNILTSGLISATGAITGAAISGTTISGSGNVTGSNLITAGLVTATGNITGGNINTAGLISATGNINAGNLNAVTGVRAVTGYFTGNVDVLGNLNASIGIVYANSGIFYGDTVTGNSAIFAGIPGFTSLGSNVVAQFAGNANSYSQINFENTSNGTLASTDFIATADNGTDTTNYVDLGINSSNFNDPVNYPGYGPNDSYVHNHGGNLILNPESSGKTIKLMVGGTADGNIVGNVSSTGLAITGVVTANGNITGGNILTAGLISATGNVSANYVLGNIYFATGFSASKIFNGVSEVNIGTANGAANISIGGTSNVAVFSSSGLAINGDLSVTGNATLSGNILGDRIQNGTTSFDIQTQNGNANITVAGTSNVAVFSSTGVFVAGVNSASGNVTGGNIITAGLITATGNINTAANISAVGNITGNYFVGNGSQLTGILTGNSFGTIVVSGQSNVVADSASDTLTLVAGSGIAITTDSGNDSVTISQVATDSIFATGGDMGTITETVTASEDLGTVTAAATVEYDLGTITTGGILTPSYLLLPSYTVSQLGNLTASPAGQFVFCSNESGGSIPAFSDGTNWRRVTDRAIVS